MQFLEQKTQMLSCREKNIKAEDKSSCKHCAKVYDCEFKEEFLQAAFSHYLQALQECQKTKGFNSCSGCSEFFECKLRRDYVDATYEKLNRSRGGEFEF